MKRRTSQSGQTLITLLLFMIIAITITTAAVMLMITGSSKASKFQEGIITYQIAESGAENALLRLLRDASYTGETLTVTDGTATVTVTGSGPYTITSIGRNGNYIRKIQVVATEISGVLTVTSWQETF